MVRVTVSTAFLLALMLSPWFGSFVQYSAAQPQCPKGEEDEFVACRAEQGDHLAMYLMGRRAYEAGRDSGDFTQALDWCLKAVRSGDRNSKRLLKMVYLQLGWGFHKDYVQAYGWLSEAIDGGEDYLVRWRDILSEKMSEEQLAQARQASAR